MKKRRERRQLAGLLGDERREKKSGAGKNEDADGACDVCAVE